jgi:hypothetical protein
VTVFVSYSSRDRDAVKSLTQDLQDADEQVWMDQRLAGGEAWWRAILEQVRGCDVFIFALSQNAIESKPCQAELQYAQALGLPVLPVQVGPVDSMQLNPLATVQAIDYRHQTPNTGMRLIAALHRERARRQQLPEPLPEEPPVPFEYLIRLYTTISNPDYLTPRDQAALVAQLQVGLGEDGQHEAARNDVVMLLTKLHDREDATHRTRTDVEGILAAIGGESPPPPPIATDTTTPVEGHDGVITPPVSTGPSADPNLAATQERPDVGASWPYHPQETQSAHRPLPETTAGGPTVPAHPVVPTLAATPQRRGSQKLMAAGVLIAIAAVTGLIGQIGGIFTTYGTDITVYLLPLFWIAIGIAFSLLAVRAKANSEKPAMITGSLMTAIAFLSVLFYIIVAMGGNIRVLALSSILSSTAGIAFGATTNRLRKSGVGVLFILWGLWGLAGTIYIHEQSKYGFNWGWRLVGMLFYHPRDLRIEGYVSFIDYLVVAILPMLFLLAAGIVMWRESRLPTDQRTATSKSR